MRVLVPVFVVAIMALTVVFAIRSANRSSEQRKTIARLEKENGGQKTLINKIYAEVNLQLSTNYFDPKPLQDMLNDHLHKEIST